MAVPDHIDNHFFFEVKFTTDGRAWLSQDDPVENDERMSRWLGKKNATLLRARLAMMPEDQWHDFVMRIIERGPNELTK